MARRKSGRSIMAQARRLSARAESAGRPVRAERINSIARRYFENIFNTRSGQVAEREAARAGSREEALRILNRVYDRQFSRSTYMGLNNG